MSTPTYDPKSTAVLLVDPYNGYLSEGGKRHGSLFQYNTLFVEHAMRFLEEG
jgi:hypothetical protein